ncbi:MAG: DNA-protecting protein DprA [Oscillospiraceae bacterium]|nr:DNA-protecting protein DprA [Oscillospiraceae bacterium]
MANLKYFLWLTTRKGFQTGEVNGLLSYFGTPEAIYFAQGEEYDLLGLSERKKQALKDKDLGEAEKILENCDRLGIHIMTIQDADYPERLGQIYDPPCVLYWMGKPLNVDDQLTVGVVGTRKSTPYGDDLAGRLGLDLARAGAVLISGMAEGIDSRGLRGALRGGGSVISVLAGGLDVVYPKENRYLYRDVVTAGTLLSEYPPGTEPAGFHFPVRNRIISGLSMGLVVVEAGEPSGALISARHALEQNREVFAFPGPVGAAASLGCNRIIQRGEAKLILSAADIMEEFQLLFPGKVRTPPPMEEGETLQRLEGEPAPTGIKEAKEVDKAPDRAYISLSDDPEAFTEDQRDILLCIQHRSLRMDDISEQTQIPARRVSSALTLLQLQDMVEEKPGKRFYAKVILTG